MTPAEADRRIILSRRTLRRYAAMASAGEGPAPLELTLKLITNEVLLLEAMAEEHPGKASKLVELVTWWNAFGARVTGKLN